MAYSFDEFISGIHVETFQTYFEGLSVDTFGFNRVDCLVIGGSHYCYFLETFVEVVQIVELESVEAVFLYEVGDILSSE